MDPGSVYWFCYFHCQRRLCRLSLCFDERLEKESKNVTMVVMSQFQMGLDDLAAERYEAARDRFEYVIELDPQFPWRGGQTSRSDAGNGN
jgi:hypothetical protein